ncbi:MAG TPA: porin family protein [Saprospiraceae bacterium]|nr:porin family protein [Saprospiraceae bacterium]
MKKVTFLILFFATSFQLVNAQNNIALGPIVGIGLSKIGGGDVDKENTKFLPSYDFGASVIFSTQANWGIGADFLYSAEGTRAEDGGVKFDTKIDYVRVPLRFIYFFGDWDKTIRPKIFVGPTFGFLVKAKSEDQDIKDVVNSFDLGAHIGAGVNIKIAEQVWLNTDVTYTHGITQLYKTDLFDIKASNRRIGLNVGVLFGIGSAK